MDQNFSLLGDDEVLHVRAGRVLVPNSTFKVSEFLDALAQVVSEFEEEWVEECEDWFNNGLRCEVLRFGNQGWQRGRVRIRLEFSPDQQKLLREQPPRRRMRPGRPTPEDVYSAQVEEVPYEEFDEEY
ncbi:MAG: KGK domain-containing protein [Cyanobacteria bacterium J06638_22]